MCTTRFSSHWLYIIHKWKKSLFYLHIVIHLVNVFHFTPSHFPWAFQQARINYSVTQTQILHRKESIYFAVKSSLLWKTGSKQTDGEPTWRAQILINAKIKESVIVMRRRRTTRKNFFVVEKEIYRDDESLKFFAMPASVKGEITKHRKKIGEEKTFADGRERKSKKNKKFATFFFVSDFILLEGRVK